VALKNLAGSLYLEEINELVFRQVAGAVAAGPFAGMRYVRRARGSQLAPKLLGTYEKELHAILEEVLKVPYERVLDIGCAEGYYAVGLALRLPQAVVNAYDIDPEALGLLDELAQLNGVQDRIVPGRLCDHSELNRYRSDRCLVVCDIEGGEYDLLRPDLADSLLGYDILVEVHDGPSASRIRDALEARFQASHEITFVKYAGRTANDATSVSSLARRKSRLLAVDEMRTYGIEWGLFKARGKSRPAHETTSRD